MTIKASKRHFDDEEEGNRELVLVALTYVGDRSLYNSTSVRTEGQWPSYAPFQQGDPQVAFVPDSGLGWFESHADFEVEYSEAAIAEALLDGNYLAPEVFGAGSGGSRSRQRVLDALGIERLPTTEEGIREELREIAGLDEDEVDDDPVDLAHRLADPDDGFTRSELKAACKELRDDSSDISLNSGKTEFAEFLAGLVTDGDKTETELFEEVREASGGD